MTARERLYLTYHHAQPDRCPYRFGRPRKSTLAAWHYQGLDKKIGFNEFWDTAGFDRWEQIPDGIKIDLHPLPRFEMEILEEHDNQRTWIDDTGVTRIDHIDAATPGFHTRAYLDFPVKTQSDFDKMKQRFRPDTPGRFADDWDDYVASLKNRDHVIWLTVYGLFWQPRDWMGFENLCIAYAADQDLVRNMISSHVDFLIATLDGKIKDLGVDMLYLAEDMAYKTASMISPDHCRKFMLPEYKRLMEFFRANGVKNVVMDSDGYVGELIPIWIEAGIDAVSPLEIAAGNDPVAYQKEFGKDISFWGGIDKRELRFDFDRVKKEVMSKVPRMLEYGGYIPQVDHGVPPDVPIRNFLYMAELIKAIAEGEDPEKTNIDCYRDVLGPNKGLWTMELAHTINAEDDEDEH